MKDHYTFLGNSLPTPPLTQHFALSGNKLKNVGLGRGRLGVPQKRAIKFLPFYIPVAYSKGYPFSTQYSPI